MYRSVLALLFAAVLLLSGCAAGRQTVPKEKSGQETNMDGPAFDRSDEEITYMDTTENVIYLAGGCFWGMEQLMQSIPGVIDAESGYANGTCEADADYKTVCKGETGFRETVRVEYDPEQVSLDALLLAYFYVIDPTVENRQGNDRGSQYQTGVYYTSESAKETVERIAEIERGRSEKFFVEIGPLKNYYPAEYQFTVFGKYMRVLSAAYAHRAPPCGNEKRYVRRVCKLLIHYAALAVMRRANAAHVYGAVVRVRIAVGAAFVIRSGNGVQIKALRRLHYEKPVPLHALPVRTP